MTGGDWWCVQDVEGTAGIIINPHDNDVFHTPTGVALDAGDKIETATFAAGDRACFIALDSTNVYMYDVVGTWTDGGA